MEKFNTDILDLSSVAVILDGVNGMKVAPLVLRFLRSYNARWFAAFLSLCFWLWISICVRPFLRPAFARAPPCERFVGAAEERIAVSDIRERERKIS